MTKYPYSKPQFRLNTVANTQIIIESTQIKKNNKPNT